MKKKLEADLISIAHRILQMKNKSDINQLCNETRKLYEKLTVLQFVEEHFEGAKPTIGQAEVVAKMKQFFEENHLAEVKPAMSKLEVVAENVVEAEEDLEEINEDEIVDDEIAASNEVEFNEPEPDEEGEGEELAEEAAAPANEISFMPAFELDIEDEEEVSEPKKAEAVQISFEDFLVGNFDATHFVKVDPLENIPTAIVIESPLELEPELNFEKPEINSADEVESKIVSLNDKLSQGINIDLNDRIGFVKNLFGNSEEDYTRVLNQLITYDNFSEAKDFILEMVKPDYDDWVGKEEYEQRFMEIIEKKFSNG
jgi:hypothetical protein